MYDVKTSIPTIVLVTNAKVHDVNMLDELSYEKGSFYIMDKGYVDFTRSHKLHTCGAYFVTRAKDNMRFRRMYSREVDKTTGIKCDQIGMLETYKSLKAYPDSGELNTMMKNWTEDLCSSTTIWSSQQKKLFCYTRTIDRWNYYSNE